MSVSFPQIHKRAGNWELGILETAVVELNGRVLAISFNRGWTARHGESITVRDWKSKEVLATHPWSGALGSAIVINGVIHIFGATDWTSNGNRIIHSTLAEDFTPSAPVTAWSADQNYTVLNTDVCADAAGFKMAIETWDGIYFLTSADLVSWCGVPGAQLNPGTYCACPTIDYVNGQYFLTWLAQDGGTHVTRLARSADLLTFTNFAGNAKYPSYIALLAPDGPGEGTNTSDVDMVECDGAVYGCYLVGDQSTWANQRTFIYFGTMEQLFSEFF